MSNIHPDVIIFSKETGDTHWTKKKPIEEKRRIEYKSDNFGVRRSFFENKMCDVRDNPRWSLSHVDDILDILENHAAECDIKRILRGYEYYILPADNEDPVFEEKRNRVCRLCHVVERKRKEPRVFRQ